MFALLFQASALHAAAPRDTLGLDMQAGQLTGELDERDIDLVWIGLTDENDAGTFN